MRKLWHGLARSSRGTMAFALLTLVVLLAAGCSADLHWDLESRILDTVHEVADLMSNQSFLLVDGYFGLALAEVQMKLLLDWVHDQGAEKCPIGKHIEETEGKLRSALQESEEKQEADDPLWLFSTPELWKISGQTNHYPLRKLECNHPVCTSQDYEDPSSFSHQGTPNEAQSDDCIIGLAPNCTVSQSCWYAQTSMNPPPHGYPLTHRLLFYQIARQLKCESAPSFAHIDFGATIRDLCEKILVDSKAIENLDYPQRLRDLFTEEVVLCGIEGFQEFINQEWTEKIMSWKKGPGCFSLGTRMPRSDFTVGDCSMHFSGLAAAALSIGLRGMMEDVQIYDCMKL